jgi:type VI secretion system protein ImpL
MRVTWGNALFMVFWTASAGVATQVYKVGGDKATMLFYWLAALGLTGSAFFGFMQQKWYTRKQKAQEAAQNALTGSGSGAGAGAGAAAGEAAGDVDTAVKDAETKMAESKIAQGAKLSQLPVIFLVGDKGSTKTTIMMHSGLEPELLSGQIYQQDNLITGTRGANFWYAKKAVFAEAGGPVWSDADGWGKLLKKLSPGKMKSVFGGKGSAPRAAVLCVDVERFLQPNASDTMASVARIVQARLQDFSKQFGISFPVYVIFTKIDRVPFFHDYVRNLSGEESTQVLGVTLPMRKTGGGVYAEEETQRLNAMFNELFYSLCDKRIEFLPRENDAEKLPACYEFPREFRKLRAGLVQFLVDIGRPSQLSTSAFLRGFYFTGVRPIFIQDVAATPLFQQQSKASAFEVGSAATTMFSIKDVQQAMAMPMASAQQSSGRKVPQWVFLSHLFNDILLEDKAAMGASEASTKTSFLQRLLLGMAAGLAVVYSLGATVSFFNNRGLEREVIDATRQIQTVRIAGGALPSMDDLKRLELLRQKLFQLTDWKANGRPMSYGWGLYVGDSMLPLVRQAYYNSFNQLLFSDTQSRMLSFLRSRPPKAAEADDYNYAYNTLRAHLMTTSEWKRSEGQGEDKWLGETLLGRWYESRESAIGDERRGLADLQFQFYGSDLHNGNPFSTREDGDGVDKGRIYLASFSGFDRLYNAMLGEADKKSVAVNFNQKYPGSSAVVVNAKTVRGAFTKPGWKYMQDLFKARGKNFGGEEWVLMSAKYKSAASIPENLDQLLKERYTSDYIKIWREYFFNTNVFKPYRDARVAADKLSIHSGPGAPVLALIGLGSFHTNVEGTDAYADRVRKAFQWPQVVVPPTSETAFLAGNNRPYVSGLSELQIAMNVAAGEGLAASPLTAAMTQQKAQSALMSARSVAAFPGPDIEGKLDRKILQIMEDPISAADGVFNPANALNAAGAAMCSQFNVINRKFPFDPTAAPEVTVDELNDLIRPGSGKFWQFYQNTLVQYLDESGNPKNAPGVRLNPAFVTFFQQVSRLSRAFYAGGGQSPQLNYSLALNGVDLLLDNSQAKTGSINVDGNAAKIGGGPVPFRWTGAQSHAVQFEYNGTTVFKRGGTWAIFRFFVDAEVSAQGQAYLLVWPVRGGQANNRIANAKFTVDLNGAPAVFDKRFFAGLRCIANVALK